jgi:hypothetical protein
LYISQKAVFPLTICGTAAAWVVAAGWGLGVLLLLELEQPDRKHIATARGATWRRETIFVLHLRIET